MNWHARALSLLLLLKGAVAETPVSAAQGDRVTALPGFGGRDVDWLHAGCASGAPP